MTRGIQLKQLSETDLGHLGLPVDMLVAADSAFDVDGLDAALDTLADLEPELEDGVLDPLAITREVRLCLEETLSLLTEALPPDQR
jgi:hypothetical protein